ncbi:DUF6493 family protein [Catenulispora yoronensis]|uniref:DUF6493 family protein n=2 Tax=Catenulispora yoronensis TaxID=450799 RepID=A0ABP5GU81_9ACTN
MSEKERRTFVKPLRAQLKSVSWRVYSEQSSSWDWNDFKAVQRRTSRAQIPASMAVLSTASAVAKYLRTVQRQSTLEIVPDAIRQVLADRNPDWLSELADELSATLSPEGALPVVQAVAAAAGVPPTLTPGLVRAWAVRFRWHDHRDRGKAAFLADPALAALLPLTFDDDDNDDLYTEWANFGKFAHLAVSQGLVPRADMLDGSLRRLLRGGRLSAMQGHLAFWTAMAATDEEIAARISSCISLLSSQNGTVAKVFLASVKKASDAGHVDLELALEAASIAVTRSEKNIVKTALGWLDALATAHPDRVAEIAGYTAVAFGAQGADIQERAVKLIGKRAKALAEADRVRLAAEGEVYLPSDLAATLAGLLGLEQDAAMPEAGYLDVAPYEPRPLLPPIGSPAELAEQVSSLMHTAPSEAMLFERVLEAVVTFSRADAPGLSEALAPVVERAHDRWEWSLENYPDTPSTAVYRLAEAAVRFDAKKRKPHRASVHELWPVVRKQKPSYSRRRDRTSPADFLVLRAAEYTAALGLPDLPAPLAIPTAANGSLDPEVLAERLRAAESEALVPLEADLHQALLRLPVDCGDVDTSGFASEAGKRFAAWVAGERVAFPDATMPDPRMRDGVRIRSDAEADAYLKRMERKHASHPATLLDLLPGVWFEAEQQWDESDWDICWPAILPSHPDLPAIALAGAADWSSVEPSPESALALAEQDDPVHAGTHYVIASRMIHAEAGLRASGVDAALVLAARGLFDGVRVAEALTVRLTAEPAGLRRVVPCLRDLANGGAAGQAWDTVAALLPQALPPVRTKALSGTAELLVLGTELAGALKVRTSIDAVTAAAEKKGGSAVANAARRLVGALGAG